MSAGMSVSLRWRMPEVVAPQASQAQGHRRQPVASVSVAHLGAVPERPSAWPAPERYPSDPRGLPRSGTRATPHARVTLLHDPK